MQIKSIYRAFVLLGISVLFLAGCSKSLNLLLEIDKEDKAIKRDIAAGEKKFDSLARDIDQGRLEVGISKKYVLARYGQPVLEFSQEAGATKLLYRHPLGYIDHPKIYLYFDSGQRLTKWEKVRLEGKDKNYRD